jgi:uncharacterized protein (TIGR03067 family)
MRSAIDLVLAFFAFLAIGGCGNNGNGGNAGRGDPRLEGTYTLIASELKGNREHEAERAKIYTFSGNHMIPPNGKQDDALTVSCDPSKSPCEIDFSKKESNGKIDTIHGIYKIEDDTLTLCLRKSDNSADRPREFKTTSDSKDMLWVMKKNK